MITLVITACSVLHGGICKEFTINFVVAASPYQCLMHSQIELAKWQPENPNWAIKRWRCENGRVARS